MNLVTQTPDARVLTMLRARALTRYQIEELLGDDARTARDGAVNNLLESMHRRELIGRNGICYALTKRGAGALALIDEARTVRRPPLASAEDDTASQAEPKDDGLGLSLEQRRLLTCSPPHRSATAAEKRGNPPRAGSLRFLEAPSRFGNTLSYRDGRITDMDGRELQPAYRFTSTQQGE